MKVQAFFKKNQWDMPDGGPPGFDYSKGAAANNKGRGPDAAGAGAFQSGLTMFK